MREAINALLKKEQSGWLTTRLIALKMGLHSGNTLAHIAETVNVDVATLKRWFRACRQRGLEAVIHRGASTGRPNNCDEQVQAYLKKGLENARWNTAVQAQEGLEAH